MKFIGKIFGIPLKVVRTNSGSFVCIATIQPIRGDLFTGKVVIGGAPEEFLFVIPLKGKNSFIVTREELLQYYVNNRKELMVEILNRDGDGVIGVWARVNDLIKFVNGIRKNKRKI